MAVDVDALVEESEEKRTTGCSIQERRETKIEDKLSEKVSKACPSSDVMTELDALNDRELARVSLQIEAE